LLKSEGEGNQMLRKLFKKISVVTISLLVLQLMSFGLGVGTKGALAEEIVDNTKPSLVSVTAVLGGTSQTKSVGEDLIAVVGQSVGDITATLSEDATLVTGPTGAITISGGTIPANTPYGTFTVEGSLIAITPNSGNNVLGQAGTFTFSVAAGTIQDESDNTNDLTTFTMKVTQPVTSIGSITGISQVGQTLTAGALVPLGATVSYQWQISDAADGTYNNIAGATTNTYVLIGVDANQYIRVTATGVGDYSGKASSDPTSKIEAVTVNIATINGINVPVAGGIPGSTIIENEQYTGVVTWVPPNNPFTASTVFTATITLTPKTGYTLTGVTENYFTVAGATATNSIDSGVITAVFTKTEALAMVQNFTVTIDGSGNAYLSWVNPPAGTFSGIRILRDGAPLVSLDPSATSFVDLTAEKGKTYFYQIALFDSASNESITTPFYVLVPVPASNLIASAGISDSGEITSAAASDSKDVKGEDKIDLGKTTDNKKQEDENLPWWGIILLIVLVLVGAYLLFTQRPKNEPPRPEPVTTKPNSTPKKTIKK